ncbi:hypothetical protein JY412_03990 [Stenotrophomonas maltophilia]|nr:hypothetical protein [Stenotrophomonas maltophilia]
MPSIIRGGFMAIEFCPLEADWGNWADWVSVLVSVLALAITTLVGVGTAVGTIGVAVLAYRTGNRAARIAEEAKQISERQHLDSVDAKLGTARILGSLLEIEISSLPLKLADGLVRYNRSVNFESLVVADIPEFEQVVRELGNGFMPASEGVKGQLYNLPDKLGEDVATLLGMTRELANTTQLVDSRIVKTQDDYGEIVFAGYLGSADDMKHLQGQMQAMLAFAIRAAMDFNMYASGKTRDYAPERALLV